MILAVKQIVPLLNPPFPILIFAEDMWLKEALNCLALGKTFVTLCYFKHALPRRVFCRLPNLSGFDGRVKLGPVSDKKDLNLKVPIVIIGTPFNLSDSFFNCK